MKHHSVGVKSRYNTTLELLLVSAQIRSVLQCCGTHEVSSSVCWHGNYTEREMDEALTDVQVVLFFLNCTAMVAFYLKGI